MKNKQIISQRKGWILSAAFLIMGLAVFSCKKKKSTVGEGTLNQDNILNSQSIDTFTLNTFTVKQDSIVSDNSVSALLGQYQNPVFGTFTSQIYTQFHLEGFTPDFGVLSSVAIDSFVIGLKYSGVYGSASDHQVEVYEITDPNGMSTDSTYYSTSTLQTSPINRVLSGHETIHFNRSNVTVIGGDTVPSQLRIHLDTNFARSIMSQSQTNPSDFQTNDAFLQYFKGLNIRATSTGSGGVHYFNLNDASSKMTIYYKDDQGVAREFDFIINIECADFNNVIVDNSGTQVEAVINDTVSGNTEFYAQAYSSRAVVKIPGLDSLPENIVIHRAILELPVQYLTGSPYGIRPSIIVTKKIDNSINRLEPIGTGVYSDATKSVLLDLRKHVQKVIQGQEENVEILLSPTSFISSAERIIFNGRNTTNKKKPKLTLLYTEY